MKPLNESRILICGTVRNVERTIRSDFERLGVAFSGAESLAFYIVESDSDDATVSMLQELAYGSDNLAFVSLGRLSDKLPLRTERLAYCRNRYLRELPKLEATGPFDYVAVADLDGMNRALTASAVESVWSLEGWDVVGANQAGPYYDIWALRHPVWSPNDCLEQFDFFSKYLKSSKAAHKASCRGKMIRIPIDVEPIEVESAFGGLAIYRRMALNSVAYRGTTLSGEEICEHVTLHAQIRAKGGKIFINPKLVNSKRNEHNRRCWYLAQFIKRQKNRILRHLGRMAVKIESAD